MRAQGRAPGYPMPAPSCCSHTRPPPQRQQPRSSPACRQVGSTACRYAGCGGGGRAPTALARDDVPLLGRRHDDLRLVDLRLGQRHVARQLLHLHLVRLQPLAKVAHHLRHQRLRGGKGGGGTRAGSVHSGQRRGSRVAAPCLALPPSSHAMVMLHTRGQQPRSRARGASPPARQPAHLHRCHVDDLEGGGVDGAVLAPAVQGGAGVDRRQKRTLRQQRRRRQQLQLQRKRRRRRRRGRALCPTAAPAAGPAPRHQPCPAPPCTAWALRHQQSLPCPALPCPALPCRGSHPQAARRRLPIPQPQPQPQPSPVQPDLVQHGQHGNVGLARAGGRTH